MTKIWKIMILVLVCIAMLSLILFKEAGLKKQKEKSEVSELKTHLDSMYAAKVPFLIMFDLKPSDFCCEGTKLMYEDTRHTLDTVSAQLEDICPNIIIEINKLNSADMVFLRDFMRKHDIKTYEGAYVINGEGDIIKIFKTVFLASDIVDYVRKLQNG